MAMLKNPIEPAADEETVGWSVEVCIDNRSVTWKRADGCGILFNARGFSRDSYKKLPWVSKPYAFWTPDEGSVCSTGGRQRTFASFSAAVAALHKHLSRRSPS
ncbi:hypothetical protein [Mesorhizobium sp. M1B.F.Ca.ET.045.04.1.1]|uniref:hypothetical protein n=1 Tax=Mesorhizobium sp. M1B.F.Ca.ET.045.04.1.1 TaxID=2493673 RepID=UPI000F75F462|nr:hypothetical protein [Mesorhizobium sp. M1B.F.Ca.ET.045.04.1.1]AZO32430.1 hypothetical protein EJ071_37210 [Mesorhizobium sp. M1B.F.Ca.ET.045.04.1.1]